MKYGKYQVTSMKNMFLTLNTESNARKFECKILYGFSDMFVSFSCTFLKSTQSISPVRYHFIDRRSYFLLALRFSSNVAPFES
jgi:hypothetical protein